MHNWMLASVIIWVMAKMCFMTLDFWYSVKYNLKFKDGWEFWNVIFKILKMYCKLRCKKRVFLCFEAHKYSQFCEYPITDKVISEYLCNDKQLQQHFYKPPKNFSVFRKLKETRQTDRYTKCHKLWVWKNWVQSIFQSLWHLNSFSRSSCIKQSISNRHWELGAPNLL
jgi:hypothetical protein